MSEQKPGFDFAAFKEVFERKDAEIWAEFYAEDAEWIEYKPSAPPRDPVRMVGRERIAEFLAALEKSDVEITLSDEILGRERAAFSVDVTSWTPTVGARNSGNGGTHGSMPRRGTDRSPAYNRPSLSQPQEHQTGSTVRPR